MAKKKAVVEFKKSVLTPKDENGAEVLLAEVGAILEMISKIWTKHNSRVAKLRDKARLEVKPLNSQLSMRLLALAAYANANRGKNKTLRFANGEVGWRTNPPALEIDDEPAMLEELKAKRLRRYIRIREEINRQGLLQNREVLARLTGARVTQSSYFFVHPTQRRRLKLDAKGKLIK